eukprot:7294888-Ditylum_brightwellii.AAC.1
MKYSGFQFVHLYLKQGYLALKHLIGHICKESIVGLQLMIALSFAQVVSGSRFAYLKEVMANRTYVPATWLDSICSFLSVCKGSVVIPKAWLPKKQRINDTLLMDAFCSSHPGDTTLKKLNLVRLYHGVITLADITNDAGTVIKPWALTGEMRAQPTIEWPNQEKPADTCFIRWR